MRSLICERERIEMTAGFGARVASHCNRNEGVGSKLKCLVLVASEMSGLGLVSSRRGCGKVGIPRCFLRDFQARLESRFLDFSALRLFHSPTRADFCFLQSHSFRTVVPETLRAVSDRESSIQVLVHRHRAARQAGAPAHRFDLQAQILNAYRVVAVHGTFELQGEDQVQISAGAAHKRHAVPLVLESER